MSATLPTPKYISFDIYGTLIDFQMGKTVDRLIGDRLDADRRETFKDRFGVNRWDEVLEYRPYDEILERAWRRTCEQFALESADSDIDAITASIGEWPAHEDVPEPLARMAEHFPLVALSNADDSHLAASIPRLGAPFFAVYSAEQAGAYKPRLRAFEYMLDKLQVAPSEILHISSHQTYDHIPMFELGFTNKVLLDRGYEPDIPWYGAVRMTSLDEVNRLLGIA